MPLEIQKKNRPYAVLIGLDSLQGVQAARILTQRNVPVIALMRNNRHHCARTNVCDIKIRSETKNDALIKTLEHLGRNLPQKAVLFPCEDANVLLVSRHRRKLSKWYHVVLPAPDVVETLMNKASFYAYAEKMDFGFRVQLCSKIKATSKTQSKRCAFLVL